MKNKFYLMIFAAVIIVILTVMFSMILKLEKETKNKMFEISTSDVFSIVQNSANTIQQYLKNSTNYIDDIKNDVLLQKKIDKNLQILITKNIKYAYLLYKDKKGILRFLADGSVTEEKAFLNQKFDADSPIWFDIYEKKVPLTIEHTLLYNLSISHIVPIIYNKKVELILAVDFSLKKVKDTDEVMNLIKNGILITIVCILMFILIFLVQIIRYKNIKKTAFYDKLTNVLNRNYLQKAKDFFNLNDYILAVLDIDYFKKINDTYGHHIGDEILKRFADIILHTTREKDDIVIRYGGEEFLVLAKTKRNDNLSALNLIERIFFNIQKNKFHISNEDFINITVSIGVNLTPHYSKNFSEAFKLADIALYNAKNSGRNNIAIYDEKNKENSNISINELNFAIEDDRVICHFQKIVDAQTQETSYYEALLRVIDKRGNLIKPDKILPVIMGTFMLRDISRKVLNICYEELLSNQEIYINVNLSPEDLINEPIIDILKNYATKENIANRLGIEIIQSEEIENYENAKNNLFLLKKLGYKIFLDNFGNGYSNFLYPIEIQADYLKIDGEIVRKIIDDKDSFLVLKSIVNFAKDANIKVIARCVEKQEIYEKVKTLDIEYFQGYFFSKPDLIK